MFGYVSQQVSHSIRHGRLWVSYCQDIDEKQKGEYAQYLMHSWAERKSDFSRSDLTREALCGEWCTFSIEYRDSTSRKT